jgi:hypothetical protein
MDTLVLENVTVEDLPPAWVKKFHPQPEQRFTVYIISESALNSTPMVKTISVQQERVALMREMERQLNGTGDEDLEEMNIKPTLVAKPFDIYKQLELGEGGYAKVPSSEVKEGVKATLNTSTLR